MVCLGLLFPSALSLVCGWLPQLIRLMVLQLAKWSALHAANHVERVNVRMRCFSGLEM